MPITLEITGYGESAHTALASAVERHKREDPLSPVSVIVWSNYMGIAARRALGQRRGVAAVNFLTPLRLAELLGSAAVAKSRRRPISTPVLAGTVRAVLDREPGHFSGVHSHPTTEQSLVKAHRTLSAVPDHKLDGLARRTSLTAEVVRVYRAVNRETAADYYNQRDLVDAAVEVVTQESDGLTELGAPIVFLPQRLNADYARLLTALGQHTELHVIVGATGCTEADEPVRLAVEQIGAKWSPPSITLSVADRALSVSDADEEVRHALRSIVAASLEGTPPQPLRGPLRKPRPLLSNTQRRLRRRRNRMVRSDRANHRVVTDGAGGAGHARSRQPRLLARGRLRLACRRTRAATGQAPDPGYGVGEGLTRSRCRVRSGPVAGPPEEMGRGPQV